MLLPRNRAGHHRSEIRAGEPARRFLRRRPIAEDTEDCRPAPDMAVPTAPTAITARRISGIASGGRTFRSAPECSKSFEKQPASVSGARRRVIATRATRGSRETRPISRRSLPIASGPRSSGGCAGGRGKAPVGIPRRYFEFRDQKHQRQSGGGRERKIRSPRPTASANPP